MMIARSGSDVAIRSLKPSPPRGKVPPKGADVGSQCLLPREKALRHRRVIARSGSDVAIRSKAFPLRGKVPQCAHWGG